MPMKKLNVAFLMLSEKKSPGKKRSLRVRARVWVRLGLGLGLGSGAFFPGGGIFPRSIFYMDLYQDCLHLLYRGKCLIARNCIYVLNNFSKMHKHHLLDIRQY